MKRFNWTALVVITIVATFITTFIIGYSFGSSLECSVKETAIKKGALYE